MGLAASKAAKRTKIGQRLKTLSNAQPSAQAAASPELLEASRTFLSKDTEDMYVRYKRSDVHLYLCKSSMLQIAPDIRAFRSLRILQICCNYLTHLPEEIGELSNLSVLFVARNRLESLPLSIHRLSLLKELNASDNNLKSLPLSMSLLKSLESLDLSGNPLEAFPFPVSHLSALRFLSVLRTNFRYFSPDILHLVFLSDFFFPQSTVSKILSATAAEGRAVLLLETSLILQKASSPTLLEQACVKVVTDSRFIRKNTPAPVLLLFKKARACHFCGKPLFSPPVTIFTEVSICGKSAVLQFFLCRGHPVDFSSPFVSLRASLFREKEYAYDRVIPSLPLLFNPLLMTKEQRRVVKANRKSLENPGVDKVHVLMVEHLLKRITRA